MCSAYRADSFIFSKDRALTSRGDVGSGSDRRIDGALIQTQQAGTAAPFVGIRLTFRIAFAVCNISLTGTILQVTIAETEEAEPDQHGIALQI